MSRDGEGGGGTTPQRMAGDTEPALELDRLKETCRRQAKVINALSEAVSTLNTGAKALKAENADLRAEAARLHGRRRFARAGDEDVELAEVAIPIGLDAPAMARQVVQRSLGERVAGCTLSNAELLVSELVTNSVLHSGAAEGDDVFLRIRLWRDSCRIEVEDPGDGGGIALRAPGDGHGMGLNLVQLLSERWGVVRAVEGPTRVWAQLSRGRLGEAVAAAAVVRLAAPAEVG